MTYFPDNIFYKIIQGIIPCYRVYEDSKTLVIMDVMPQSNGHSLVVPKEQFRNILDADPLTLSHSIMIAQKVAVASIKAFNADGIILTQYNEMAAGQTIFHLHFHVIPRYKNLPLKEHSDVTESAEVLQGNSIKLRNFLIL